MNMSHLGIINKSLQSHDSTPLNYNPNQSLLSNNYNSLGMPMPENGGMLKKAIRFEY